MVSTRTLNQRHTRYTSAESHTSPNTDLDPDPNGDTTLTPSSRPPQKKKGKEKAKSISRSMKQIRQKTLKSLAFELWVNHDPADVVIVQTPRRKIKDSSPEKLTGS